MTAGSGDNKYVWERLNGDVFLITLEVERIKNDTGCKRERVHF